MSEKHTPGPWQALPPKMGAAITIYAEDGITPICTTASNGSPVTMAMHRSGEVKANARLIAAAPELMEALQEATRCLAWHEEKHGVGMDAKAVQAARAAIAKAGGAA